MVEQAVHETLAEFGGGRLSGVIEYTDDDEWEKVATESHTLAGYDFETHVIKLSPAIVALLKKACRGQATPRETAEASEIVAHEIWHAASGGGGVTKKYEDDSPEFTIEEGSVQVLARLTADGFARKAGLWARDEDLRESALWSTNAIYTDETEKMLALANAAVARLDHETLHYGGYQELEGLQDDDPAVGFLRELHTKHQLGERERLLVSAVASSSGLDVERVGPLVSSVLDSKSSRWDLPEMLLDLIPEEARGGFDGWDDEGD